MILIKSNEEVELIRQSSKMVSDTLAQIGSILKPGISGIEIDKIAEEYIRDHGGRPAFKGYRGFPASICVSVNEAVVHGMPTTKSFRPGDVVSVDCGVLLNGYYGDSAYSFLLKPIAEPVKKLAQATYESLYLGIHQAKHGNRVGDISYSIQSYCESNGYSVVRELVGHGLGKNLHEEPDVPNFGKRGQGAMLKENMVIAIEPMINMGKKQVETLDDNWTVVTRDRKVSMHYEHTICVKIGRADVLSDFTVIETALKNNNDIEEIK